MNYKFVKAKFKVGDVVGFPYGRKIGRIKAVGLQVTSSGDILGLLYKITSYELTEQQLKRTVRN